MKEILKSLFKVAKDYWENFLIFTIIISIFGTLLRSDGNNPILDFFSLWFCIVCLMLGAVVVAFLIGVLKKAKNLKYYTQEKVKTNVQPISVRAENDILNSLAEINKKMGENGIDGDILPSGYGVFGLEATNPIPVSGVLGGLKYLGELRTLDGEILKYRRRGSTSSHNINGLIDVYELYNSDITIAVIYLSPYNMKNSIYPPIRDLHYRNMTSKFDTKSLPTIIL